MDKLILASDSPRRKEILEKFGYQFEIITSDYKEEDTKDLKNEYEINTLIKNNCYCKAKAVADKIATQAIVIGADTVVTLDSVCLIKPCNFSEAFFYLKKLSGRMHVVKTGIALVSGDKNMVKICETKVYFRELIDEEITNYIETFKPYDKAGAYGIQDFMIKRASEMKTEFSISERENRKGEALMNAGETSGGFIEKIEGSYYNVMGICPYELENMLDAFIHHL